jgi:hypothetical protein
MSNAADKIKEQAARFASRHAAQADADTPAPPSRGAPAPRNRPVRRTVDLSPVDHDRLTDWQRDTARQLGRTRITGEDVLRALVARLLTDDTVAEKIRADLHAQR